MLHHSYALSFAHKNMINSERANKTQLRCPPLRNLDTRQMVY